MVVHICRGTNRRYRGMVRLTGHRKWVPAGPWRQSHDEAAREMFLKFLDGPWKRGQVWFVSDYYDPVPTMEVKR